ncbi:copper chaperone for superoxide dismutase-like [Argiope bruennichi]|uniref:Extracellular superoxide dismutase [Cu-Zn] n=1 Tax=Argiope bruennichi TaxID=94029 RepID=A0A8T0FPM5_ARGBR|nr:copper chaperone for superoxide dismutase-like [Argiope bruennichi]KAF8792532.1 Copper chaperone for superoxide dismutase like protein [Argiope bruennichi]
MTSKENSSFDAPNSRNTSNVEFDVNLSCKNCASSVENVLSKIKDIKIISIDVEKQSVVVESSLPSQVVKEAIESTGKRAVLKGFGSKKLESAVAEIKGECGIFGVVRFHQADKDLCVIDGTVDGLSSGEHGLHIHEYGDLSQGCESIGPHFNPTNSVHGGRDDLKRHYGDLGNIVADSNGRASFRIHDNIVKVFDIIGRSLAVTAGRDDLGRGNNESSTIDGNSGKCLAAAIIARSAGLFENPKRICQCDGITVWDETNQPKS